MINNVVLVGRLTKDPELRKTQSGLSTCTVTVACDRPRAKDGTQQADFITVQVWRQAADFLAQYAQKGTIVGVEGRIQTRNYDGADGKKVYVTEVLANQVRIIAGGKGKDAKPAQTPAAAEPAAPKPEEMNVADDDLPF